MVKALVLLEPIISTMVIKRTIIASKGFTRMNVIKKYDMEDDNLIFGDKKFGF